MSAVGEVAYLDIPPSWSGEIQNPDKLLQSYLKAAEVWRLSVSLFSKVFNVNDTGARGGPEGAAGNILARHLCARAENKTKQLDMRQQKSGDIEESFDF
eukprot:3053789-Amphidinium_carterae.1